MHSPEELIPWYELRDRLRSDFIRCMEAGRPFPRIRQRMLDRVEDVVVQMERQQQVALTNESGVSNPSFSTSPQPHRDASRGHSSTFELEPVTCHDHAC